MQDISYAIPLKLSLAPSKGHCDLQVENYCFSFPSRLVSWLDLMGIETLTALIRQAGSIPT